MVKHYGFEATKSHNSDECKFVLVSAVPSPRMLVPLKVNIICCVRNVVIAVGKPLSPGASGRSIGEYTHTSMTPYSIIGCFANFYRWRRMASLGRKGLISSVFTNLSVGFQLTLFTQLSIGLVITVMENSTKNVSFFTKICVLFSLKCITM